MRISLFLPHVGVFGGVRRFLELGNSWRALGHEVTLFHPGGEPPAWLPFSGVTAALERAPDQVVDLALCADPHTFATFAAQRAGVHLYYCVIEGDPGVARAHSRPDIRLAANSGPLRRRLQERTPHPVLDGAGGINVRQFHPGPARPANGPLCILLNGRRSRPKKGTDLVLRALAPLEGRVPPFEIVLFDSLGPQNRQDPTEGLPRGLRARYVLDPSQAELVGLYQSAHLFVAAERKAGWCNTALEAMACGAAVVCTRSGTSDFARDGQNALVARWRAPFALRPPITRLLRDGALRERLAAAGPSTATAWTWEMLAAKLLAQLGR